MWIWVCLFFSLLLQEMKSYPKGLNQTHLRILNFLLVILFLFSFRFASLLGKYKEQIPLHRRGSLIMLCQSVLIYKWVNTDVVKVKKQLTCQLSINNNNDNHFLKEQHLLNVYFVPGTFRITLYIGHLILTAALCGKFYYFILQRGKWRCREFK